MPEPVADISNFTGVFRANLTGSNRKITKRNRQPISCASCRARKSKCDRQQPCGACTKRGDALSCEFGANAILPSPRSKESAKSEAQIRLQRLEEMVSGIIQAGGIKTNLPTPPISDGSPRGLDQHDISEQVDRLSVNNSAAPEARVSSQYFLTSGDTEPSFVGPTHWTAILEDLQDIRDSLDTGAERHPDPPSQTIVHDMYFGPLETVDMPKILAALPPRSISDSILSIYFSNKFFLTPFIHAPSFRRNYNAFWENPSSASFMWISTLFSTLCIGTSIAIRSGRAASLGLEGLSPRVFQDKAGQCIVSGQYMRAQPMVIDAMLLYVHGKYMQCVDADPSLWAVVSLLVRLAQKMGMHRQPEKLGGKISPFEAEMRRRRWYYIECFDVLLSFQIGMPPIINDNECDIQSPSNLTDADFDENTTALNPRSETDYTPLLFHACKAKMIKQFRRALRHALSTEPSYTEALTLDRNLRQQYQDSPDVYKAIPIRDIPFTDDIQQIMQRVMLEMLYLKSLCILHRPYLSREKQNPKYKQSRTACSEAALRILDVQFEFQTESRPGGRLHEDRWILTSLTMHDFLMAAMITGVELLETQALSQPDRMRRLNALYNSYNCWSERKHVSRDAAHACRVIASILNKVSGSSSSGETQVDPVVQSSVPDLNSQLSTASTGFSGLTDPLLTTGDMSTGYAPFVEDNFDLMDLDSLDDLLGDMGNLDWGDIDHYLRDLSTTEDWTMQTMT